MRLGYDVDGVSADFNDSFIPLVKAITGRDLFGPGYVPTCWDYPTAVGYTAEEVSKVWDVICANPTFWMGLRPYFDAMDILERLRIASYEHDVYFITSRPGIKAKQQTEVWLATHSGDFNWNPTVLISSAKGACAKALHLDAYIDDRLENVVDVAKQIHHPMTKTFLLDRPWNQRETDAWFYTRVDSAAEMLDQLGIVYKQAA